MVRILQLIKKLFGGNKDMRVDIFVHVDGSLNVTGISRQEGCPTTDNPSALSKNEKREINPPRIPDKFKIELPEVTFGQTENEND